MANIVTTRRQSIRHFQQMSKKNFVSWINLVDSDMGGILRNVKTMMKVDGLGARFGKDEHGRVFFEGSRTGPIFDSGAFSAYTMTKTDDQVVINRAKHYDDMLELIRVSPFIRAIPWDCKIVCEIFYNPMAILADNVITFVTVGYDKLKVGSVMTILPYTVLQASTGEEDENREDILHNLYIMSTPEIMIVDPNLEFGEIDINEFIDATRQSLDIQEVKDSMAKFFLGHPRIQGKFKLGPDIEGIVLYIDTNNTRKLVPYKITTEEFKVSHRRQ